MDRHDSGYERNMPMNGRRGPPMQIQRQRGEPQAAHSPQHEELIKYICDSWNKVCREMQQTGPGAPQVGYYHGPTCQPKGFKPFDLEAWWGKRVVQNITQNS
ncbi:MAPK regulated corepressor interacting protein 2 [Nilaparvata lugens]|uniref:MAPK regulated corepressor interacting protein 2 n=1 Tax=Nilaparvata lugens TaxID=108931 RepID=UPI000B97CE5A|nr:MAPK regulated corepressor interacting protein 2 [Nilaparvata lugens]